MRHLISEQRIVALLLLVLSAGLVLSTFGLQFADLGGAFSPMFFPRIILMILLVLTALNLVIDMMTDTQSKELRLAPTLLICAGFVAYVLLIVPLGYFISSVLLALLLLLTLGIRNPLVLLALPVTAAGSLVGLFNHVLKMPLPTSPFYWWI
jgi:hypothetical protein